MTDALENPTVVSARNVSRNSCAVYVVLKLWTCLLQSVQQMVMLSTSVLNIKWTLRGKPKSPIFSVWGVLIVRVDSLFSLNQISGQVIEHQESWDLSESSLLAQVYFWTSRSLFATAEGSKDISDFVKDLTNRATAENKNVEIYPDPTGDPTKVITYSSHTP